MTTQTEALKRIAAYPFSRAEELSVEQMREIAREALAQQSNEHVPHCEAGPEYCWKCNEEMKPTYGNEEIRKLREVIASQAKIIEDHIPDAKKMVEPPPWWPAVENILNEYGLQAIDFVADFKAALAQQSNEQVEPAFWYSAQEDEFMTHKIRKEHERLNSYTHKVGKFDLPLYIHPPVPTAQPEQEPTKLWCDTCEGTGEVYQEHQAGCHVGGHFKCPDCDGEGYVLSRLYSTTPPQHKEPEQEPVAFETWYEKFHSFAGKSPLLYSDLHCAWQAAKLYTTPPQRTWVGLTDEEIEFMPASHRVVARWAEAKLKEKNT